MLSQKTTHCWWFDSHNTPRGSSWLQSTIAELNEKMMAMLKLIEEDADSFAERAEMYYKKRPELIGMVEEFYRSHRSLAEKYDKIKSDSLTCLQRALGSPVLRDKYCPEKSANPATKDHGPLLETIESEESYESVVEDPRKEGKAQASKDHALSGEAGDCTIKGTKEEKKLSGAIVDDEVMKLKEEIERLKEENRAQKEELLQKDEEKREVIRQLSSAIVVLKEENVNLRKCIYSRFGFSNLRKVFRRIFSSKSSKYNATVVPL